jgi:hypothetical protein
MGPKERDYERPLLQGLPHNKHCPQGDLAFEVGQITELSVRSVSILEMVNIVS